MEVQIYAGKCRCGSELDMRIIDAKDEKPKSKSLAWIVYGFCKKCEAVYCQGLFVQEEKPVPDRDFIINWKKQIKSNLLQKRS